MHSPCRREGKPHSRLSCRKCAGSRAAGDRALPNQSGDYGVGIGAVCRREGRVAETLLGYQTPVRAPDGKNYMARACGRPLPEGMWEGWVEFDPIDGGTTLRSQRETTQPNKTDAEYWA